MKNITPGHWIFAGIFAVGFIGTLIWAYWRDIKITKVHYRSVSFFTLALLLVLFLMFVFRKSFQ